MKLFKPNPPVIQPVATLAGGQRLQYFKRFLLFTVLIETERQDVAEFFRSKQLATLLDVLNSKIIKFIGGVK